MTAELDGAFADPGVYAHRLVYPILTQALGEGFVLGRLGVTRARAELGPPHRELASLFGDEAYDAFMPSVGISLVLGLGESEGEHTVFCASHHARSEAEARALPATRTRLQPGTALLLDARVLHASEHLGADVGTLVAAYHRKWFRAWDGGGAEPPIQISRRQLQLVPEQYRHLFAWRFDRHGAWRRRNFVERALSYLPSELERSARRILKSD